MVAAAATATDILLCIVSGLAFGMAAGHLFYGDHGGRRGR